MVDTPPETTAPEPMTPEQRQQLRMRLCEQRRALSDDQLQWAGEALAIHARPVLAGLTSVAGYLAINGEIPMHPLFTELRAHGTRTCVPVLHGETLLFAPFDENTPLVQRRFGLLEPDIEPSDMLLPEQLGAALVPLAAVDAHGHRIGMGGGYYDRSFAFRRHRPAPPLLIGVAHHFQQVPSLTLDWWDVAMDQVVTDRGLVKG